MGSGISQVVAQAGFQVTMVDVDQVALDRGLARIDRSLERLINRGTVTSNDAGATRSRLAASTDLEAAAGAADHVIESVVEIESVKAEVLGVLDRVCRPDVVIASNTSQIAISKLAAATTRP